MNEYIKQKVDEIFTEIVNIRRNIHKNPELSEKEYETSKFIQSYLIKHNVEFKIVANTGVYAYIHNGKGKNIAFRADIDALPIFEESGVEFSSVNSGVMHACGHDTI